MAVASGEQLDELDGGRGCEQHGATRSEMALQLVRSSHPVALSSTFCLVFLVLISAVGDAVPVAAAITIAATAPAILVDLRSHRLPDRLVGGALIIGTLTAVTSSALGDGQDVVSALAGAAVMATPLLALHLVSPAAMGFGDVKLAAVLGAALGLVAPTLPIVALALGCSGSAIAGLALRRRTVAFGPGLAAGAVAALLVAALWPASITGLSTSSTPAAVLTTGAT